MPYSTLPASADAARRSLNRTISLPDITIVLILGTDSTARDAQAYAKRLSVLEDYKSVAFIEVADINGIMPVLKDLQNNGISLEGLDDCIALTISPGTDTIAYRLSKARYNSARGYMKTAILRALALG